MIETPITIILSEWISEVTGREPVFDNLANMGPRASRPAASMVLGGDAVGLPELVVEDIEGEPAAPADAIRHTSSVLDPLLISMNLVGGDTLADMRKLRGSLGVPEWTDRLYAAGLGFAAVSGFRDLTEIVKGDYEPRHQADWEFNQVTRYVAELPSIESVEIKNGATGGSVLVEAS